MQEPAVPHKIGVDVVVDLQPRRRDRDDTQVKRGVVHHNRDVVMGREEVDQVITEHEEALLGVAGSPDYVSGGHPRIFFVDPGRLAVESVGLFEDRAHPRMPGAEADLDLRNCDLHQKPPGRVDLRVWKVHPH